ncbi:MAG TPA: hypothetical protein DD379_23655 [Cyanobacteria bacterium UBA11162]|nr:hypothetical protein [Cyanobacteria bacterium UBA12227]HAX85306.1 hypothetical protein [Cyanobacteria bacterium UBA11370]HBL14326.1 hypothetical protein [Cyanobacteria bacterium UBA11162]HBY81009.1 hypothetical protein [Cyanobacteria bacterium UBA11148]
MKELIKSLVDVPTLRISLLIALGIYTVLLVYNTNKNSKFALDVERIFVFFVLFCLSKVNMAVLMHFNPAYLVEPPLNAVLANLQVVILGFMILTLGSRTSHFFTKKMLPSLFMSGLKNPFFWTLILLSIISAFWSDTPLITFKAGMVLVALNLLSLYIVKQYDWLNLFWFLRWNLVLIASLSMVIRTTTNGGGLAGITFAKNELGGMMALSAVLWILQAIYESKHRWFAWGIVAFSVSVILQAKSTGAQFIFLVLLALSALTSFLKKLKSYYAVIVVASFLAISIIMYFVIEANLEHIVEATGKDLTFTGRRQIWEDSWDAIQNRLWLGYGTYSFWQGWRGLDNPAKDWMSGFWMPPNSHQGFLDIWIELGLIGLILFIASLLLNLVQAVLKLTTAKGIESILPLILVVCVIMTNLSESKCLRPNFFWTLYTLTAVKLSVDSKPLSTDKN